MSLAILRPRRDHTDHDFDRDAYEHFRLGLSFADVRAELKAEQDAAYARGEYMFVGRRTVLGRMHQYKREAWEHYLAERKRIADEGLPF